MKRAERLPLLLEILQQPKAVTTGPALASAFGVNVKATYRDIETLRNQGYQIETTADGFRLQKQTASKAPRFTPEEFEAIFMGLAWLAQDEESPLVEAAERATAKIEAMLPPRSTGSISCDSNKPLDIIRVCIEAECRLHLHYSDAKGIPSTRVVWPIELYSSVGGTMIAAWCEQRHDFRNFRIERIQSLHTLDRYPVRRQTLLARWQLQQDEDQFY